MFKLDGQELFLAVEDNQMNRSNFTVFRIYTYRTSEAQYSIILVQTDWTVQSSLNFSTLYYD